MNRFDDRDGPQDLADLHDDMAHRDYWSAHARLGIGLSLWVLVVMAIYSAITASARNGPPLLALIAVGFVLTAVVSGIAVVALRASWRLYFFYAWSVAIIAVLLVAAAIDGGDNSPIAGCLFLPLMYAALAYPPAAVHVIGLLTTVGYVAVALTDSSPSAAFTFATASALLTATGMASQAAANRDRRVHRLASLSAELRAQAIHDSLTECLNRRGFEAAVNVEIARVARHDRPLALLLIDVDHLKTINDGEGHAAGDAALRTVATAIQSVRRRTDVLARIGGDEFALLASDTDVRQATRLADRLHKALAAAATVTVSIGIAATGRIAAADRLLARADAALYDAKAAGRNCTRVANDMASAALSR